MIRTCRRLLTTLALALAATGAAHAAAGVPDRVPGASLLVPFFETGVDVAAQPHDTLLVVQHTSSLPVTFRWSVWDVDGAPVPSAGGNATLQPAATWSVAMRDVLGQRARAADRDRLRQGSFYRGFVTIDLVTAATDLNPFAPAFPFANANVLEGYAYFTGDGDANGLAMVPLEYLVEGTSETLRGFHRANEGRGGRERLDATARRCASRLTTRPEVSDCLEDSNGAFDRIHSRAFQVAPLAGTTRLVVFAWDTFRPFEGGPSVLCEEIPELACAATYRFFRYRGDGTVLDDTEVRLDHVVNVFDLEGFGGALLSLWNVPDVDGALQLYAFTVNRAQPPGRVVTWQAILEAYVLP